ncbi:MAG: hypothetical protein LBL83_04085, partial [Clostridiales bacterium]|nr:hypothetical protein [Clostridiales bacterium]
MDNEPISWHPGFAEGLRENYIKYSDGLEFNSEFQLAKEPLRIDILVIKKRPELVVDTGTGRIFRGHNIFEYKSPGDYASVSDFQKSCAYVWLYAVESKADILDITLSFVVASHPKALLGYCTERLGYAVEEKYPGIHYVTGGVVPIQVIVSPKLGGEEAIWLGSLRADLNASDMEKLLRVSMERTVYKRRPAFLNVILAANPKTLREVREMIMTQGLREALIDLGLAAEWEKQG